MTTPEGRVTYVVYKDLDHEARVYPGWHTNGADPRIGYTTGPIVVYRDDRSRSYAEVLTMSVSPGVANGAPTGTESIDSVQTLTRNIVNAAGQLVKTEEYHNLGQLYDPDVVTLGQSGTNYYRTEFGYDAKGLLDRTKLHTGTIHRTVHDSLGRASSTWIGTDDTPTSGPWSPANLAGTNTVVTASFEYDLGYVGDGNLTLQIDYPGGGADDRFTIRAYDWRNRLIATKQSGETLETEAVNIPIYYVEFNNLGETIRSERYDGDTVVLSDGNGDGVPDRPAATKLRGKTEFDIDDQGRTYRTKFYSVDPTNGAVGTAILTSQNWFDRRGHVLKTVVPGVTVTKYVIDGAGRTKIVYVSDGGNDNDEWQYADDVDGDTVLEQVETEYDKDGLPIKTTVRQRFHDEMDTGALTDPNGAVQARASYSATYYDLAGRVTASVNVGAAKFNPQAQPNQQYVWTRPSTPPTPSDTVLVNSWAYNEAGWVSISVDPRGLIAKTYYDNLGRVTTTIENYVNGEPSDADDKTTEFEYDGSDNLTLHRLVLPDDDEQTTEYFYEYQSSTITSNDLLSEVWHPDEDSGEASPYEAEFFEYNALGETVETLDRNGWTHKYLFDPLGRLLKDEAWAGSSLDVWLETAYDGQGNAYLFSTWDNTLQNPTQFSVINQVKREFDGRGQMVKEWQEHDGEVISTSAKVEYAYAEQTSGGTMFSRLTGISYPAGSGATYAYGTASGLNDRISRVNSISGNGLSESYQYLGMSTVVSRASGIGLTWQHYGGAYGTGHGEAGDKYAGLDRFGRAVGWLWQGPGGPVDFHKYGFDRNSNRMYKTDELYHTWDELYHADGATAGYDGLNQLTQFQRGVATDTNSDGHVDTIVSGSIQTWDIDAAGNFDDIGFGGPSQDREHNRQNQITELDDEDLDYDANGNLTWVEGFDLEYRYDPWNRLIAIVRMVGDDLEGPEYEYDALGRRIVEERWEPTPVQNVRRLYYNDAWQVIHDHQLGPTSGGEDQGYASFQSYYWSIAGGDQMIGRARATDGVTQQIDERLYSLQDAQGNQSALVNAATNEVVERAIQSPYGKQSITDRDRYTQAPGTYKCLYFHQGLRVARDSDFQFLDNRSQLYDNRARMYSPYLMRFMQNDPLGLEPDPNMYRYVGNGPVSGSDPSGLQDHRRMVGHVPVANDVEAGLVAFMKQYEGRSQTKEAGANIRRLMVDITMVPITPMANTYDFVRDIVPAATDPYYQPRNGAFGAFLKDPHGQFGSAVGSLTFDATATVTIASSLSSLASRTSAIARNRNAINWKYGETGGD